MNNEKKILILNGPKSCGKDTAAQFIIEYLGDNVVKHMKFSSPLKQITSMIVGKPPTFLEASKEVILPNMNASYRDLQIATYMELSKIYSSQWLGHILARQIDQSEEEYFVVSDGGRPEDIEPIVRRFKGSNIAIAQIIRSGTNFDYDIRGYISDPRVNMFHLTNENLLTYKNKVIDVAMSFYGEEQ